MSIGDSLPDRLQGGRPILGVDDLRVSYRDGDHHRPTVHGISFKVDPGEVVALVGESGSGKTTTALSIIGLLADNGRLDSGKIKLNGTDIAGWSQKRLEGIRGSHISLIPQDPASSLNPVKTIGAQVGEILQIHKHQDPRKLEVQVIELLDRVGLSHPALRARQYPHELSGGMRQRVLIAIAIALRPSLIIADEPTSALDVTVQMRILDLIDDLRREFGTAVLLVTHDLGIAADRANRIIVMKEGRIDEQGTVASVLVSPRSDYTRKLLSDAPSLSVPPVRRALPAEEQRDDIIVVQNLVQEFSIGGTEKLRALDGISFRVARGTTHAIVGESGSGKTTAVRNVVGFQKPTSGHILVDGVDLSDLFGEKRRQFRRKIQLVYQNPFGSLDPLQTNFQIVEEPLLNFGSSDKKERARRVHHIVERVGLSPAVLTRKPTSLSGGQRQRIAIARSLIIEPEILVLDEAVSALDVTVQAQILNLLDELQNALGLTYLFVSHDLAVVRQISDTVSVLHNGRIVDEGSVDDIFLRSTTDYTRELIAAIPGKKSLKGDRSLLGAEL